MAEARLDFPARGLACLQWAHLEVLEWGLLAESLCMLGGLVLVLAFVGPMGVEDHLAPLERLAFWSVCGALCWPLCHALSAAILYLMRFRPPVAIMLAAAAGALFFTVPCAAVTHTVYGLFRPQDSAAGLLDIYPSVAVLALACSALVHYVTVLRVRLRYGPRGERPVHLPGDAKAALPPLELEARAPSQEGFFDRLPGMPGRDVVYLNVSGHYLNVVTTTGSCLVLMRLSDAVVALGDLGIQVHRSYWVAHRHVAGVVRDGRRIRIRVTGPCEVPVSRTHMAAVREAIRIRHTDGLGG